MVGLVPFLGHPLVGLIALRILLFELLVESLGLVRERLDERRVTYLSHQEVLEVAGGFLHVELEGAIVAGWNQGFMRDQWDMSLYACENT